MDQNIGHGQVSERTTDLPIAAIADRLHFADQSSFSKFFIRLKGITPKVYRRK